MVVIVKSHHHREGSGDDKYPASTAGLMKEMFPMVDRDGLTKPVIQTRRRRGHRQRASRKSASSPSPGKSISIAIISSGSTMMHGQEPSAICHQRSLNRRSSVRLASDCDFCRANHSPGGLWATRSIRRRNLVCDELFPFMLGDRCFTPATSTPMRARTGSLVCERTCCSTR